MDTRKYRPGDRVRMGDGLTWNVVECVPTMGVDVLILTRHRPDSEGRTERVARADVAERIEQK